MTRLILIPVLLVCLTLTEAQRTYMRSCDCERYEDGNCVYSIKLPTGNCPDGDSSNSTGQGTLSTKLAELHEQANSNTQLLAQVQGALIDLLDGSSPNFTSANDLRVALTAQSESLMELRESLVTYSDDVQAVETELADVKESVMRYAAIVDNWSELNATDDGTADMDQVARAKIATLEDEIRVLKSQVCMKKAAMVLELESRGSDEIQLNASSYYNSLHGVQQAGISNEDAPAAWCPAEPNEPEEWIDFDLAKDRVVFGVVTKGRADYAQWVTSYRVQYRQDVMTTWQDVTNILSTPLIFPGNQDQNTAQVNMFPSPIKARQVRVIPLTAPNTVNKCLRVDLVGCYDDL